MSRPSQTDSRCPSRSSERVWTWTAVLCGALVSASGLARARGLDATVPASFAPGSTATVWVVAWGPRGPQDGVALRLLDESGAVLAQGTTDEHGGTLLRFVVPLGWPRGSTRLLQLDDGLSQRPLEVAVDVSADVLVTTDRDRYRGGHAVQMRVLVLERGTQRPVEGVVATVEVMEPGGETLLREEYETTRLGIVTSSFPLSEDAPPGRWRFGVTVGKTRAERVVHVVDPQPRAADDYPGPDEASPSSPQTPEPLTVGLHWLHPRAPGLTRAAITVRDSAGRPAPATVRLALPDGADTVVSTDASGVRLVDVPLRGAERVTLVASRGREVVTKEYDAAQSSESMLAILAEAAVVDAGGLLPVVVRSGDRHGPAEVLLIGATGVVGRRAVQLQPGDVSLLLAVPRRVSGVLTVVVRQGEGDQAVQAQTRVLVPRRDGLTVSLESDDGVLQIATRAANGGGPVAAGVELAVLDDESTDSGDSGLSGVELALVDLIDRDLIPWVRAGAIPLAALTEPDAASAGNDALRWRLHASRSRASAVHRVHLRQSPTSGPAAAWLMDLCGWLPRPEDPRVFSTLVRACGAFLVLLLLWLVVRWLRAGASLASWQRLAIAAVAAATLLFSTTSLRSTVPVPDVLSESFTPRGFSTGAYRDADALIPHERFVPGTPTVVRVAGDAVWVEQSRVLELSNGEFADTSTLISPLYEELQNRRGLLAKLSHFSGLSDTGRLILVVGDQVPAKTLRRLQDTVAAAGFFRVSVARPSQLTPVVPPAPGPSRWPWSVALFAGLIAVGFFARRRDTWSWVALVTVTVAAAAVAGARRFPHFDPVTLHVPMEEALSGLALALVPLVAISMGRVLRAREGRFALEVAALPLLWTLVAVPLLRDHRVALAVLTPGARADSPDPIDPMSSGTASGLSVPGGASASGSIPTTIAYRSAVVTDGRGVASFALPRPDPSATRTVRAFAHAMDGAIGLGTAQLAAPRPIVLSFEAPSHLAVGDRILVPITVRNRGPGDASVPLTIRGSGGLEVHPLVDPEVTIRAGTSVTRDLWVRADVPGRWSLEIAGGAMVAPQEIPIVVQSARSTVDERTIARVLESGSGELLLMLPHGIAPGTLTARMAVNTDLLSEVAVIAASLQAETWGCAEQAASILLTNLLLLRYLRGAEEDAGRTQRLTAAARDRAARALQRLLSFEKEEAGRSCPSDAPVEPWLRGYVLEALALARAELGVAREGVARLAQAVSGELLQGRGDGSLQRLLLASSAARARRLLGEEGAILTEGIDAALTDVRVRGGESEDPYVVALAIATLVDAGAPSSPVSYLAERLLSLAKRDRGGGMFWKHEETPVLRGRAASVETTARAIDAIIAAGKAQYAWPGIVWLLSGRPHRGRWYSSYDTARALEALISALEVSPPSQPAPMPSVTVNGVPVPALPDVPPEDASDVPRALDISSYLRPGRNVLSVAGDGLVFAVASATFRAPWGRTQAPRSNLRVTSSWNRAQVRRGEVTVRTLRIANVGPPTHVLVARLPLPPGFAPEWQALMRAVLEGTLERWQRLGDDLVLYLPPMQRGRLHAVEIPFRATNGLHVEVPAGIVYDPHAPANRTGVAPTRLSVHSAPTR